MKRQNRILMIGLILAALGIGLVWMIGNGRRTGTKIAETESSVTRESEKRESDPGEDCEDGEKTATPSEAEAEEIKGTESEQEEAEAFSRQKGKKRPDVETEPEVEELGPPKIMIASDTHLLAKELMDGGTVFQKAMEADDGKTVAYSGEIVDALLDEAKRNRPDALVLSGDLTFEGERLSHQELAGKLKGLQDEGVQVLVIPGNHDINNPRAASYLDREKSEAEKEAEFYHTTGELDDGGKNDDNRYNSGKDSSQDGNGKNDDSQDDSRKPDHKAGENGTGKDGDSGEEREESDGTGDSDWEAEAKSEEKRPDGPITAEEFLEIYQEFGYAQAISRDEHSLSYLYPLRDNIWLMMLDTNQYEPENLVDGEIRPETYQWMIEELNRADEEGALVVPVGHHNLLSVSRLYTRECMIQSRASALWLFGEHHLPLYLSGHLHVQRMKKYRIEPGVPENAYGVHEIVTSSLGMAPHQYGVLAWDENRQMEYTGRRLDVEGYARRIGSQDENLLNFSQYTVDWYYHVVETQIYKKLHDYPEDIKQAMAHTYADVLYHYGAGETMDHRDVESTKGYRMWERLLPDSKWMSDIRMMLKDMEENG